MWVIDSYPTAPRFEVRHNIPYQPSGFIFYFNIQMSTRFTVSTVDGRAYATPLVDTITIRAIERRFFAKLVDSGVRQHQHMLKNDRNYPVFAVVLFEFDLSLP